MAGAPGRSGGSRPDAGRRSSAKILARYVLPLAEAGGMSPLDYMLSVIRDTKADAERRDRMAICAAPYCHPKVRDRYAPGREIKAYKAKHAARGTEWEGLLAYPKRHDDEPANGDGEQ